MDFVHDQLATGKKLRVPTIVDTFSRFSPALEPRFTFRGTDVVEVLERVGRQVGFPATIRVDQGTEFMSRVWTCGLINAASRSTSRAQASLPITRLSRHSTGGSERNV